jgi:hypothetical protein
MGEITTLAQLLTKLVDGHGRGIIAGSWFWGGAYEG